jgi:hypothetical protein
VRTAVVFAAGTVVLAIGSLLVPLATGGRASTGDRCPQTAGGSYGKSFGKVTAVLSGSAYVRGGQPPARSVAGESQLYPGNALCTDEEGVATFEVKSSSSRAKCNLGVRSRLVLGLKGRQVRIRLLSKKFKFKQWCDAKNVIVKTPQNRRVKMPGDPLFVIDVSPRRSVISVKTGFVQVLEDKRIVGPRQQVVSSAESTSSPVLHVLGSTDQQILDKLARPTPVPGYSRPTARQARRSPTLQRILRRNRISVGLGPTLTPGSAAAGFVRGYFGFLAGKWRLRMSFQQVATLPTAKRLLSAGRLHVFVNRVPPGRTLTASFFGDKLGRTWSFAVDPDAIFLKALTTFLQSALNTGDYDRLYRRSLGDQPPVYRAVSPLIFPLVRCRPAPNADLTSEVNLQLTMTPSPSGPIPARTRVVQLVEVRNKGMRNVDCVTLHFRLFGGSPLNFAELSAAGCKQAPPTKQQLATGERELNCALGRLETSASRTLRVVIQPDSQQGQTETCADVNADESGGLPEVDLGNNGACAQIVYRDAPLILGAAEDVVKQPTVVAAKAKLDLLQLVGLDAVVVTAKWTKGKTRPTQAETTELQNVANAAQLSGMELFVAVQNADAANTPNSMRDRTDFADYAAVLASMLPSVGYFIVGNEPNNERFWKPQYLSDGTPVSPPRYVRLLAATYDAVKKVSPQSVVIGGALAPRGVDAPVRGRDTVSPTTFINLAGDAYAELKRQRPIMDAFALHPIPEGPAIPPGTIHPSPSKQLAIGDYPSLVSLLAKAFDVTALPIYYTEYGIQTRIPGKKASLYTGTEGRAASEKTQGDFYRQAIALASCQKTVAGLFFFLAVDEVSLAGWQSGVFYADETPKKSFAAVKPAVLAARTRSVSSCPPAVQIP